MASDLITDLRTLGNILDGPLFKEAADELDRLTAEIARLREALKPFADIPPNGDYGGPMVRATIHYEDQLSSSTHIGPRLSAAAFRAARQALEQS